MIKPQGCFGCPFRHSSTGFVPDQDFTQIEGAYPVLFAVVLKMPTKEELVTRAPMSGKMGKNWEAQFLLPLGIRREQLIITNTLRCYPNAGEYPTGLQRHGAVKYCRRWDDAIKRYSPNLWGVSIHPGMLIKAPNQADFLRRALARAKSYAEAGYRPCLLLGEEAKDCYLPWLEGGQKKWQGHWEAA